MTPTELDNVFHTMHMHSPDNSWYMAIGLTTHGTNNLGKFSKYFTLNKPRYIIGNGNQLPILGHGTTIFTTSYFPYLLIYVSHIPFIIKNLVSVRKFSRDNLVAIKFDPFGFTVKGLFSGKLIT